MTILRSGDRLARLAICRLLFVACGCVAPALTATAQQQQVARAPLLFKEEWREPPHTGERTDENMRFTPSAVTNDRLDVKLYGQDSTVIRTAQHEGRVDLWTGLATSPVAVTLRDKRNFVDLTAALDGAYVEHSHALPGREACRRVGMKWFKLDPVKVVVTSELEHPDLSKVDEVGLATLAPGGGHGVAGSANLSTVELFARPVPR